MRVSHLQWRRKGIYRSKNGRGGVKYTYYLCERCGSIFIDTDIICAMDNGETLIEYTKEYWNMEFQAAKKRCFGVCLARIAEVVYYATIPIVNFLDIGGGTGILLDAISQYLPDNKSHFYSVEKYPPEDGYRTKEKNFYTCSYSELNQKFQAGICMEVVEHLTPKMLVDMFREIAMISEDNAIYLVNTGLPKYVMEQDPNYLDPFKRGHIISYSTEGMKFLLEPLGYRVLPIRGKDWAFCIEYNSGNKDKDITGRIWKALPENLSLLHDSNMGDVLQILGRESVNGYLIYG